MIIYVSVDKIVRTINFHRMKNDSLKSIIGRDMVSMIRDVFVTFYIKENSNLLVFIRTSINTILDTKCILKNNVTYLSHYLLVNIRLNIY